MYSPAPTASPHPELTAFLERAASRLAAAPPDDLHDLDQVPQHGDHRLSPGLLQERSGAPAKPAAVLIAIVDRAEGPTVLFTQRSSALRNHSGQISFPGGRIDPADTGPLDAALREAEEEIGLARHLVQPIGYLDLYLSNSGYRIAPVVALADASMKLHLNPAEVSGIFECPLSFLMDQANHVAESREWRGAMRRYYAMPWQGYYIWGVTAGIVRVLYETVYG
ncbi:CoA pyrophosphatase [Labrys monachus]|uniref:8-oxo-dGTP pyrophosphatase MutT (NUDIX family) n=1 Tax=Labrys monachus TaxID=217067 RepID=A0ABU0FJK1_9HYPH|nr:CoA pyrophosphatase [Labrys monachus]MDQ0394701.1 8-oxo-dGTP pyrophosphatase MutT (NUDIX family) [Labrys monachus]